MINLKPTFSQLGPTYGTSRGPGRHGHAWSFVEWLSKDGPQHAGQSWAAGYRREVTFTLLTPKIILNQWVDAMSEGSSDCMLLIEECVQASLVGFPAKFFYLGRSSVVRYQGARKGGPRRRGWPIGSTPLTGLLRSSNMPLRRQGLVELP
jgi:hypothetical protein